MARLKPDAGRLLKRRQRRVTCCAAQTEGGKKAPKSGHLNVYERIIIWREAARLTGAAMLVVNVSEETESCSTCVQRGSSAGVLQREKKKRSVEEDETKGRGW